AGAREALGEHRPARAPGPDRTPLRALRRPRVRSDPRRSGGTRRRPSGCGSADRRHRPVPRPRARHGERVPFRAHTGATGEFRAGGGATPIGVVVLSLILGRSSPMAPLELLQFTDHSTSRGAWVAAGSRHGCLWAAAHVRLRPVELFGGPTTTRNLGRPSRPGDRKSTRLNSSHVKTSYADFCLKKKNNYK